MGENKISSGETKNRYDGWIDDYLSDKRQPPRWEVWLLPNCWRSSHDWQRMWKRQVSFRGRSRCGISRGWKDVGRGPVTWTGTKFWTSWRNGGEFYKAVGYTYDNFSLVAYKNVVSKGEKLYREKPEYWQGLLKDKIKLTGEVTRRMRRPLVMTECWGIVDYKDWPMLGWDWVKELCELGTLTAARTGMWAGIATSNFCGPQFVGMWRDVEWHRRLTSAIHSSVLDRSLTENNDVAAKLLKRL